MSLQDNALTTLAAVKQELSLTDSEENSYLRRLINAYSDMFERLTNRKWYRVSSETEYTSSRSQKNLYVKHYPIESIDSIHFNGSDPEDLVDSDDYEIHPNSNSIRKKDGFWSSSEMNIDYGISAHMEQPQPLYKIVYTGGYVTPQQAADDQSLSVSLPFDIEDAVIRAVADRYRTRGVDETVSSKSSLSASVSYRDQSTPSGAKQNFYDVASRYRALNMKAV